MLTITVNGEKRDIQSPGNTPLLYVLRNELNVNSPQFGCGLAQCGICSVLLDGKEIRSCITPVSSVGAKEVTTVEGLPARWAKQKHLSATEAEKTLHPVQQAWIEEQTPLCGFCQSGMMIKAAELLENTQIPPCQKSRQHSQHRDLLPIFAAAEVSVLPLSRLSSLLPG